MCKKCKDERCAGFYSYRLKEFLTRYRQIKEELLKNEDKMFILIKSSSSKEIHTEFNELHIIEGVTEEEQGKLIDKRYSDEGIISDVSNVINIPDNELDLDMSYLYSVVQLGNIMRN